MDINCERKRERLPGWSSSSAGASTGFVKLEPFFFFFLPVLSDVFYDNFGRKTGRFFFFFCYIIFLFFL